MSDDHVRFNVEASVDLVSSSLLCVFVLFCTEGVYMCSLPYNNENMYSGSTGRL